jgi:hypothetical protein
MTVVLVHRNAPGERARDVESDFTVGDGIEVTSFGSAMPPPAMPVVVDIDVSDRQVRITLANEQPLADLEHLRFQLATFEPFPTSLTEVFVNPATNWAGFTSGRIIVDPNNAPTQFSLELSGLTAARGQQIVLDVVPEPATSALLLAAAVSLPVLRGRSDRNALRPTGRIA